jgi:uncharacterized protein (TIGR02118 family)
VTVKVVVLFTPPGDLEAFEQHYRETHLPLAGKVPGLQRLETGRFVSTADGGEQTYYRMAEMYFADEDALQTALRSPEMRASGADFRGLAAPGSRIFIETVD